MSATLKSEAFANYFSVTLHVTKVPAPIVNVEGRAYFVTEFFLDSLKSIGTVSNYYYNYFYVYNLIS